MSGQRPRVVVFDLGKVLVDFDYSIAVRRFADRSEAGLERVQELVNSPIQFDYESGLITTDEFFAAVRDGAGFRGDRAEFVEIFADIFSPMELMMRAPARGSCVTFNSPERFSWSQCFGSFHCTTPIIFSYAPTRLQSGTSAIDFRFTAGSTATCCPTRKKG